MQKENSPVILFRVLAGILLVVGVVVCPWYLELVLVLCACFIFSQYYEALFISMCFGIVSGSLYTPLVSAAVVVIIVEYIKTKLAFYNR